MFEKVKEKYLSKAALKAQTAMMARKSLHSVTPKTQRAVLHWLEEVQTVKNNAGISLAEKRKQLQALETSDIVTNFVRSLLNKGLNILPGKSQGLEKFGKLGNRFGSTTVSLTKWVLPTFVMSGGFETFAEFIRSSFRMNPARDHHAPVPDDSLFDKTMPTRRRQQKVRTKAKVGNLGRHETAPRAQVVRGH